MQKIDAATLNQWVEQGDAVVIDIRSAAEYAQEHIPHAISIPMEQIAQGLELVGRGHQRRLVLQCLSGQRCHAAFEALAEEHKSDRLAVLEDGLKGWKHEGLPLVSNDNKSAKLPIMRQVQIGAGSFIIIGYLLGLFVHPSLSWISFAVGCGLLFAGLSGWCGLALLLAKMPWNKG